METSTSPLFVLYVVWHPDYANGGKIAELLRERFGGARHRDFAGDRRLSVIFRSAAPPDERIPLSVDWDEAEITAAVVLAESALTGDSAWLDYVRELAWNAQTRGSSACLFPIAMELEWHALQLEEQALRWDRWEGSDAEREQRLVNNLTHEFSRMLRHRLALLRREATEKSLEDYLQKIRVFISHSKHDSDGEPIARSIRDWLHKYGPLSSFLDVHDLPPGVPFQEPLLHRIETSVVLALHTDSYSSREWCRREVIEAKRRHVPLVVVDCLRKGDRRSIPYMGNTPIVRMDTDERNGTGAIIECLLEEVFRTYLWRCRVEQFREKHPGVLFTARPPELIALAALPAPKNETGPAIVYPDPPLGADEARLFKDVAPNVRLWTLIEWLDGLQ